MPTVLSSVFGLARLMPGTVTGAYTGTLLWTEVQAAGRLQQVGDGAWGECLCVPHVWHS